jgi:hypothetical protein
MFLAMTLTAAASQASPRWHSARYVRPGQLNREQYFRMLDRNRDGWLSYREYDGDLPFAMADLDRNGYLSWGEWRDSRLAIRERLWDRYYQPDVDSERLSDFLYQDRNNDEFLTRREWRGNPWTFSRLDHDRDGAIHITEYIYN